MTNFLAGIVTYNPDLVRLRENLSAVHKQLNRVLLVDNGSHNIDLIEQTGKEYDNVVIIKSEKNEGIAAALNIIGDYALKNGFPWFLTLDQDSVISKNLIKEYKKYITLDSVGMLTCVIKDRNYDYDNKIFENDNYKEVKKNITSGSLVNTEVFEKNIRFDESLFIDNVDFDFSMKMRKHGYKIYRIKFEGILHEIGQAETHHLFGITVNTLNHNSFRRYYIARNNIIVAKRYKFFDLSYKYIILEFINFFKVVLFEKNKKEKILASLKGYLDGIKYKDNSKKEK